MIRPNSFISKETQFNVSSNFQTSMTTFHNHTTSKFTENTSNTRHESKSRSQYYFLLYFSLPRKFVHEQCQIEWSHRLSRSSVVIERYSSTIHCNLLNFVLFLAGWALSSREFKFQIWNSIKNPSHFPPNSTLNSSYINFFFFFIGRSWHLLVKKFYKKF